MCGFGWDKKRVEINTENGVRYIDTLSEDSIPRGGGKPVAIKFAAQPMYSANPKLA